MEKLDTVKIYRSFRDAARDLPDRERLQFWDALMDYALDGIEPDCSGLVKTLLTVVLPSVDKYRKSVGMGQAGGRPKKETSEKEKRGVLKNKKGALKKEETKDKDKDNDNDNDKETRARVKNKFCDFPQREYSDEFYRKLEEL